MMCFFVNDTATAEIYTLSLHDALPILDEDRIDVYGTDAKLSIDRYRSLRVEVVPAAAGGAIGFAVTRFVGELAALPYAVRKMRAPLNDPSFTMALEAFVRGVRDPSAVTSGVTEVTSDVTDGFRAAAVIEAAESSARSHRAVAVDGCTVPGAVAVGPTGDRAHA